MSIHSLIDKLKQTDTIRKRGILMNNYYIASGSGSSETLNNQLVAFDSALIQAGIDAHGFILNGSSIWLN